MNRLFPVIALLFACDPSPAAVSELDAPETPAPTAEAPASVASTPATDQILEVDWVLLPSFAEVLNHSDVVVRGEVVGTSFDAIRHHDPEDPAVYEDLPLTISSVAIREVLHGTIEASGAVSDVIDVQELGGRLRSGAFAYPGDKPPLQAGQEVILCMQSNGMGRYSIIGGVQGRFAVVAGRVEPLFTGEDFNRFEGAPLERLTTEIKAFAASRK